MAKEITAFDYAKAALTDDALKSQIALALPKHLTPDRALRIALTAALNNPKIGEACKTSVGKASLYKALLTASQLGLEVDGRQGHLVPFFSNKLNALIIQFIPGYQGLIGLAYNHPKVKSLWAEAVYEKDTFVYKLGLNRTLEHIPHDAEDRGPLTHAYAVAELEGGAKTFVCLPRREVMKAKASSKGADSDDSPWKTHEAQMWVKTAVRQLAKFIPQSTELRSALEIEDTGFEEQESAKPAKPVLEIKAEDLKASQEEAKEILKETKEEAKGKTEKPLWQSLQFFVEAAGVSWEDFSKWLVMTGRDPGQTIKQWQDIPEELCQKLLDPKSSQLQKCITIYGKPT